MTRLAPPLVALGSWFLVAGAVTLLIVSTAADVGANLFHYQDAAVGLVFPALGWLVLRRRRSHPIGWILLIAGLSGSVGAFAEEYVTVGVQAHPGAMPAVEVIAWLGSWTWAFFFALLPLLLLLFPDGQLPSMRWRPILWMVATPVVLLPGVLAAATWSLPVELLAASADPEFPPGLEALFGAAVVLFTIALLAALVSLGVRWRRSRGVARQQLKVFLICAAVGVACLGLSQLDTALQEVLGVVAFLLVPAGMVAAILRYRLYDIDRIVSRTVSYAIVSAVLVGLFLALIVGFQQVLPESSDLATAASTLAVAAAFNPIRRRVQSFVDRRFNRSRYDAERTASRFIRILHTRRGVGEVGETLEELVAATLEPAHLSLWLPEGIR